VAHHSFEVAGCLVGVRTNSHAFAAWLADAMPVTTVDDERGQANYSVWISEDDAQLGRRFHLLYRDSRLLIRTFDAAELARTLLSELEGLTYRRRDDAAYLQASLFNVDGVAGLFPEGMLSAFDEVRRRLRRRGLHLPATRHVAIDLATGKAIPIPDALEFDAAEVDRLVEIVPSEPTRWPRVSVREPTGIDLVCTVAAQTSEPAVPVSRGWALYSLSSGALNLAQIGGAGVKACLQLVERAACWGMSHATVPEMAETALSLFARARSVPQDVTVSTG
jgi:hypothetical protein